MSQQGESPISYHPTAGLTYDPDDPKYFDPVALDGELTRAFEICHGCRMCFKYCDSFPILFDLIDNRHGGDVRKLDAGEKDRVLDACFQCKLCEVQCPYTPREKHAFQLDFPKLVHRAKAARARRRGLSVRERVLGNPDRTASLARASLGVANAMNRVRLHRWFMEKFLGIHRHKLLPNFAAKTLERYAREKGLLAEKSGHEAVLFQTCYVQNNEPEIGCDTLDVMAKNRVDCRCVEGLECCGMPAWEHGDLDGLRGHIRANLDRLVPHVDGGSRVLVINPTCAMMLRREYPELAPPEDRERARRLAAAVMDPSEYLWSIRKEERFNTDYRSSPGPRVSYHAPCHLRAQAVGFKGRDLAKKLPGVEQVSTVMECCGHDGTYAMSTEGFEPSQRIGKKAFDGMRDASAEIWMTDCPLAAIQFQQHAGRRPMHPMTVLARAYRESGFSDVAAVVPAASASNNQDGEKK